MWPASLPMRSAASNSDFPEIFPLLHLFLLALLSKKHGGFSLFLKQNREMMVTFVV